jgi:hypothetical protein
MPWLIEVLNVLKRIALAMFTRLSGRSVELKLHGQERCLMDLKWRSSQ